MRFLRFSFVLIFIFSNILAPFSVWAEETALQDIANEPVVQEKSTDLNASTTDTQTTEPAIKEITENNSEESTTKENEISSSSEEKQTPVLNVPAKPFLPKIDVNSGALVYAYPFDFPKGINGLTPNFSLNYNSQRTNNDNIVGYGWELDIPKIERINKNGTDKLYNTDYFSSSLSLELTKISENKYRAKIENGEFIEYSFENNIWIAKTKSGILYTFGLSEADRQDDVAHRNVSKWMLSSIKDTNDNEIKFTYFKDKGQIYPDHISYAGIYDISFIKELRSDSNSSYATAFSVKTDYRISGIVVKVSSQTYKNYKFSYITGANGARSLLSSIDDGIQKTDFNYSKAQNPNWISNFSGSSNGLKFPPDTNFKEGHSIPVDFNNDGYVDILTSYAGQGFNVKKAYKNNGDGTWVLVPEYEPPVEFYSYGFFNRNNHYRIFDVNNDGLPDITKAEYWYPSTEIYETYLNTGSGWKVSDLKLPLLDRSDGSDSAVFSDLNGDGLLDIYSNVNTKKIYLNSGDNIWIENTFWNMPDEADERAMYVDINGDGITDIINDSFGYTGDACQCTVYHDEDKTFIGDGRGGYILTPELFSPHSFSFFPKGMPNPGWDWGVRSFDINNDNLMDLVYATDWDYKNRFYTYLNNANNTWSSDSSEWRSIVRFSRDGSITIGGFIDIDADGIYEMYSETGNETEIRKNSTAINLDILNKVTQSSGGYIDISYKPSSHYKESDGSLMNPKLPYVMQTVEKIITTDPVNNIQSTETYKYKDGRFYFDSAKPFDRKFAGFGIVEKNENNQRITKTYFHTGGSPSEVEYAKIGKIYKTEIADNTGKLYQRTLNKWDVSGNFVKLSRTINETWDGTQNHRDGATEYIYDDTNGNVLKETNYGEVTSNTDSTFSDLADDASVTTYDYSTNDAKSIWKLKNETLTPKNSRVNLREKRYWYDGLPLGQISKGNTTREDVWTGGSFYAGTKYEYDSYGNITKVTDPMNSPVSYKYDAHNLFPVSMTNILGHETLYEYDYLAQKPSKVTDANGNSIYYKYDPLGRVLEERVYDGSLKTSFIYVDTPSNMSVEKTSYLSDGLYVKSYTYFDGLGRKIQEKSSAENNQWITKDYIYNEMGNVSKESLPYLSNSSAKTPPTQDTNLYTNISYDVLGRPIQTSNIIGSSSILYNTWHTTYTDMNGNKKEEWNDARGNVIEVFEHNKGETYITKYTYNLAGDRLKAVGSKDNVINYTYDKRGLKLSEEEPHTANAASYGTIRYEYDANGRMIKKIDLKAETTSYFYDKLNRMTSEVSAKGDTMSLYYDENQNGKGNLTKIENGVFLKKIFYNPLALPEKEEFTKNSNLYTFSYFYDIQGNLLRFINSDLSEVRNTYNTLGKIEKTETKTKDGEYVNIVNNFDYSPTGLISLIENANGTKTENIYSPDDLYRLKQKLVTNSNDTTSLPVQENSKSLSLASDGSVYIHSNSWNTDYAKRTGAGVVESNLFEVKTGRTKDKYRVERGFLAFDTSSIPDRAEILSAKVTLYVESRQNPANDTLDYVSLFPSSQKDTNTLAKEDYQNTGSIELSDKKDITNIKAKNFISFSVNAEGLKNIDKAGITKFSLREGHDVSNTDPKLSPSKYSGVSFRSSLYEGTQYDPVIEITYTNSLPAPKVIESYSYTYDKVGNILEIKDESELSPSTTTYAYEDLYRLISAKRSDKEGKEIYNQTYTYDSIGNLTSKSGIQYLYQNTNPFQATRVGEGTYKYDRNGNMTEDPSFTHTYNHKNELIESIDKGTTNKTSYSYDNQGQRYTYTTKDKEVTYFNKYYNIDKEGNPTKHIWNGDTLIATQTNKDTTYINTDHLGSTTSTTNEKGEVTSKTTYYPYGTILSNDTYTLFDEQRKYTGHEYDKDTDLTYANARYYDQDIGRFLSPDPLFFALGDQKKLKEFGITEKQILLNPQLQNPYSYSLNNPVKYTDPTGKITACLVCDVVLGLFIPNVAYSPNVGEENYTNQNLERNLMIAGFMGFGGKADSVKNVASMADDVVQGGVRWSAGIPKNSGTNLLNHFLKHENELKNIGIESPQKMYDSAIDMIKSVDGKNIFSFPNLKNPLKTDIYNVSKNLLIGLNEKGQISTMHTVTDPKKFEQVTNQVKSIINNLKDL